MDKTFEKLKNIMSKNVAISHVLNMIDWDNATLSPSKSIENSSKIVGILSDTQYELLIQPTTKKLLDKLISSKESSLLSDSENAMIKCFSKIVNNIEPIPSKEYKEFSEYKIKSSAIWTIAKKENDYQKFTSSLKTLIQYKKKFIAYRMERFSENNLKNYDVLLNDFEEDFTCDVLDPFFEKLKGEIIPLLKKIMKKSDSIDDSFLFKSYPVEKQREFSKFLAKYIGFNFNKGVLSESVHPFTIGMNNKDVRITVAYDEFNITGAIFSLIHECGHAIYEMNISDELTQTPAGVAASMGIHESQSRFYENMIGKSYEFWKPIYPKLKELFPDQLKNISVEQFVRGINKVVPSCIRVDADELTYTLHVIIRYEIEKLIFSGKVKIKELPGIWNSKYSEYLDVSVKNDAEGILQDIHWSSGDFGYFPSYAIGNAIAAQLYAHIKKVLPFEQLLLNGDIKKITDFLNVNIHKFGACKKTNEFLTDITGKSFDADFYIKYLKDKYSRLYDL